MIIAAGLVVLKTGMISQRSLFLGSISLSTIGACLFFNFGGVYTLLMADGLVYGFSGVAMGIAEGWGTRAATENTSFSQAKWRMLASVMASLMRLQAPPLARALVAFGGRNSYAFGQMVVILFGLYTCIKASRIMSAEFVEKSTQTTARLEPAADLAK